MEIGDAERFGQLRDSRRNFSGGNLVGSLPVLDCLVHISLVSLKLRQRVVRLDHIEWLCGFQSCFVRGFEQLLQPGDSRGQRAFANLADALQVLIPIRRLGEFLEKHISENLSGYIRRIAHRSLAREGEITGLPRTHPLPNAGLILGKKFENDVT